MPDTPHSPAYNLTTPYRPVAIYYEGSDIVEYIREDVPAVYGRVDDFLTLIFDLRNRERLIGFSVKGFRNFYTKNLRNVGDFVSLVGILELKLTEFGNELFEVDRKDAYERARKFALENSAALEGRPAFAQ